MRATISFEVDVERVQETMAALVLQEAAPLHQAMDLVETTEPQDLYDGITQALEILGSVSTQLQQYRDMLVSFERARLETVLPQSPDDPLPTRGQPIESLGELQDTVQKMTSLQGFLDKINEQGEETKDAPLNEEG